MGLDMYLFKASKPDLTFGIYRADDNYIQSLAIIPNDDYDAEMYADLKPFMTRIHLESLEFDGDKIAKDYGLKSPVHISSITPDGTTFFSDGKTTPPIPSEILKNHYSKTTLKTVYAVELQEKYYWRKAYGVQEIIHNHLDNTIENCGYYLLDNDTADAIENFDNRFDANIVKNEKESCIFYHEWY